MTPLASMAKLLIMFGIFMVVIGALMLLAGKIPGLGKLPGDIYVQKGNFTFYFPVVTSIILSILLTLVLSFVFRR
ncbi:DUF2905 domain-containing protein [Desulforamulus ferrireducens]|uniref:DUF2905 domain-containing protein n=1 Tax=Desulforamulus ferrireducens TaxID=1833852 RepID=A0A1S6IW63_9FIRM|nr:DUF2905 domain-containing protein [Desulforamulus ferrireducens]AQS59012.1 hypothetical protein B0537_07915 [Desulforamulus ferrireducens]